MAAASVLVAQVGCWLHFATGRRLTYRRTATPTTTAGNEQRTRPGGGAIEQVEVGSPKFACHPTRPFLVALGRPARGRVMMKQAKLFHLTLVLARSIIFHSSSGSLYGSLSGFIWLLGGQSVADGAIVVASRSAVAAAVAITKFRCIQSRH